MALLTMALLTKGFRTKHHGSTYHGSTYYGCTYYGYTCYGYTYYEPAGHSTVGMSKGRRNPSCSIRSSWPVGRRTCTEGRPRKVRHCLRGYTSRHVCRYAASRVAARILASYTRRHMSFVAAFKWRRGLPARRPPAGQAGGGRRGSCSPWHSRRCRA